MDRSSSKATSKMGLWMDLYEAAASNTQKQIMDRSGLAADRKQQQMPCNCRPKTASPWPKYGSPKCSTTSCRSAEQSTTQSRRATAFAASIPAGRRATTTRRGQADGRRGVCEGGDDGQQRTGGGTRAATDGGRDGRRWRGRDGADGQGRHGRRGRRGRTPTGRTAAPRRAAPRARIGGGRSPRSPRPTTSGHGGGAEMRRRKDGDGRIDDRRRRRQVDPARTTE